MPNQFLSPEGDLENYFLTEYWLIDQYIGDQLWIWGHQGYDGEIGNNSTVTSVNTPVTTFAGGSSWKQVSLGNGHSGGIKTDGTLWTWGTNSRGQLGNARIEFNGVLTPITTFAGGTDWKQLSLSGFATFGIKTDGTLWSWGDREMLGANITDLVDRSTPITTFTGGTNWKQINGGFFHVAAIKTDGTLWGWGDSFTGQLGNGVINSFINLSTPVTTFAGGNDWKQVSCGRSSTAAIKTDGTLWTWGYNGFNPDGTLGNNDGVEVSTPITTFAGGTDWKQVACGANHMVAIKTNGTLWSWGNSVYGQLGNGPLRLRYTPVTTFAGGTNWADISTSDPADLYTISTNSAIKTDGTLWSWGRNLSGQLGNNSLIGSYTPVTTFSGGTNWKQISSAYSFSLAIKTDGTLWTWGNNFSGRMGIITPVFIQTPITTFAGGTNWADTATSEPEDLYTLSAGTNSSFAIKTDGTLWAWGNTVDGILGTSETRSSNLVYDIKSTPVTTFAGGTNWKQVYNSQNALTTFADKNNVVAIKTDGTLWTWGYGGQGSLGNAVNTSGFISTPITTFSGGSDWKQACNSGATSFAIKTDGTLWSWGRTFGGKIGNAVITGVISTPVTTFAGGTDWKQVSASLNHAAAIKTDGTLWIWGNGFSGALGNGITTGNRSTPMTTFAGGTDWKQVSTGRSYNTAAIKTDGTLWTWGSRSNGRLGDGSISGSGSTPVTTFAGGTDWKQVSIGYAHTSAIKTDGTLWTWGNGSSGKLGTNDTILRSTPVTTFAGGTDWKQVSSGFTHTIALRDNGVNKELFVWGDGGSGRLGTNDIFSLNRSTPITTFAGGTNWKQVSAGRDHTSAIKTDGTLWTWGNGSNGRLGNASTTDTSTAVTTFAGGTDWKQVSGGRYHVAAIKTDGTLWVWGYNDSGRLGNGQTTGNISTPITTFAGGTNWKQVSTGGFYSLAITAAIKTDGTLWTWGDNFYGGLGNASTTDRSTPVTTFAGGTNWKQVSVAGGNTAAIKTDGTLWTWGYGFYGELGNETLSKTISTPITTFAGGTNWKQVISGPQICALRGDGINNELYVFGKNYNDYDLGIGIPQNWSPKEVHGNFTNWKQIDAGYGNTIAVKTDGTLWTWGYNSFGQIGNNTEEDYINRFYTPVTTFAGGNNWRQVSLGRIHAAAVKTGISPDLPLS